MDAGNGEQVFDADLLIEQDVKAPCPEVITAGIKEKTRD